MKTAAIMAIGLAIALAYALDRIWNKHDSSDYDKEE